MSQKHQKYAHFLREHFQFATEICSSDITSAAIALRFCVELIDDELGPMCDEKKLSESQLVHVRTLKQESKSLVGEAILKGCAHFQYDFEFSKYQGEVDTDRFRVIHDRIFHLINQYLHIREQSLISSKYQVLPEKFHQEGSSIGVDDLFQQYIRNFKEYRERLAYPYVAVVNFRKSLELYLRLKLARVEKNGRKLSFDVDSEPASRLRSLYDESKNNHFSKFEISERDFFDKIITGDSTLDDSKSALNELCHFKTKDGKKLWNVETLQFKCFVEIVDSYTSYIEKYKEWFFVLWREWEEVSGFTERPQVNFGSDVSSEESPLYTHIQEPLKVEESSFQTTPKVSDGASKRFLMLVPFTILLGIGGWFLTQEQPAPQRVPSSKSTLQKSKRSIAPVKRQQKVFSTTVSLDELPLKGRRNRFDKEAKKQLLKKAQKSGYKKMIGELKYDGKKPKCSSSRCSWDVEARFTK